MTMTKPVTPMEYRGWSISHDLKPIPSRIFDWTATTPDYDVDCDEGGYFCCAGDHVNAATYEELLREIDATIEVEQSA